MKFTFQNLFKASAKNKTYEAYYIRGEEYIEVNSAGGGKRLRIKPKDIDDMIHILFRIKEQIRYGEYKAQQMDDTILEKFKAEEE